MTNTLIQSCINLSKNPGMYRLADALKLPQNKLSVNVAATAMMVGLWSWAADNAPDGNLTGCPAQALADAASWRGKPQTFFDALLSSGWIDKTNDGYYLHDWEEYKCLVAAQAGEPEETRENTEESYDAQKESNRARQRKYRSRKKLEQDLKTGGLDSNDTSVTSGVTGNVTDNVTGVTPGVTGNVTTSVTGVTDNVTGNVTESVTHNVTEERGNVEGGNINNNLKNNNTYVPPTYVPRISSLPEEICNVTDNADTGKAVTKAAELCGYFEENCHQMRSMPLLNAFTQSLLDGAEPDMIRAVIDETALGNVDKSALYVARILENLRDEQVRNLADYKSRNERHRAESKKKNGNDADVFSDSQLDSYDQEWLERVKRHKAQQHSGKDDA